MICQPKLSSVMHALFPKYCPTGQKILRPLWNGSVYYRIHRTSPLDPILSHALTPNFLSLAQRYSAGLRIGWSGVRIPAGAGNFSLHRHIQTGSGAHPASYLMGIKGSFPGGRVAGAWSWKLASILCRGRRVRGAIPPLPQYASMAWCSVKKKHRDNFTF
jgi:hypothetical protein